MHVPSSIFCSAMALMPKFWASLRSAVDFSIVGHRNKPLLRWQLRSPRPSLESLDPPAKNEQAEYNVDTETGKFYDVSGTATARIQARRGLLVTQTPFYFQGK